jgi:putative ABC transport system permease protein
MAIPISYNLRNLAVRKTTTIMTALGVALTVAVLLADLALVNGLNSAFAASGDPLNVLVLRKGANSEINSGITRDIFEALKFTPGIARNAKGEPMASIEMVTVISLKSSESIGGMNVTVRAISPTGIAMRHVKLAEGRWFRAGQREVVVGKSVAKRYPAAQIGRPLRFGKGQWQVVGIMDAGQGAINSEIWGDLAQVSSDFNRADALSSVLVRATSAEAVPALINSLNDDRRLNVDAISERDYYEEQTISAAPVKFLGIFVAIIMAVGSCFAAMNTMYAAVARRAKEIGTLRVLGFSRGTILFSFFLESLVLSAIGGLIGILLVLPLDNVTTGIGNFITFSEIAFNFRISPTIMAIGIGFALVMGAIGGLFPARNAAKKEILVALREI